jgi:hypothetical protein
MLKGKLKEDPGYIETWGTIKGVIEVWREGKDLVLRGECTDIVELHTWLLPSIQNAHPDEDLYLGDIKIPEFEAERDLLRLEIRAYLEAHSARMERVTPERRVRRV